MKLMHRPACTAGTVGAAIPGGTIAATPTIGNVSVIKVQTVTPNQNGSLPVGRGTSPSAAPLAPNVTG